MVNCKECKNWFQVLTPNESNAINFCKLPHKSKDKYKIYEIEHEHFNDSNIDCTEFIDKFKCPNCSIQIIYELDSNCANCGYEFKKFNVLLQ